MEETSSQVFLINTSDLFFILFNMYKRRYGSPGGEPLSPGQWTLATSVGLYREMKDSGIGTKRELTR